jgi:hypothetical protein
MTSCANLDRSITPLAAVVALTLVSEPTEERFVGGFTSPTSWDTRETSGFARDRGSPAPPVLLAAALSSGNVQVSCLLSSLSGGSTALLRGAGSAVALLT